MSPFKLFSIFLSILVVKANSYSGFEIYNIILNKTQAKTEPENNTLPINQTESETRKDANLQERQDGLDEIAAISTGSAGADSALKITGFVFKFLTQTVSSIFGQNGLTGAVTSAFVPSGQPQTQPRQCIVQSPPQKRVPQKQQAPRSGQSEYVHSHIPAKAIIYNLISNHEYIAQLFQNIEEEKLLGVVAIVSKNRIIPLVVNAVDVKSLKLNKTSQSIEVPPMNLTEYGASSRQDLEDGGGPTPAAESALKITGYVFSFLTQTVTSVFGGGGTGASGSDGTVGKSTSCVTQQAAPRTDASSNQQKPSIPEIKLRNDYFNKIFNITSDEQQKILGIVAIISKSGVLPLVVKAVDLGSIEENPLTNIFRNWDQILETTTKSKPARGPDSKYDIEIEIVKQIQSLRKAHPWLLPSVF